MSDALAVARAFGALHAGICIPDYEKVLTQSYYRFLRRIAEPVILDVGAHAGLHLEQFALLGRVIAFEPIPEFAQLLRERYHGRPNIEIR
jgi:hypothetical protein